MNFLSLVKLVEDSHQLGDRQSGFREDTQFYRQDT
jgi:hypothetical protein